MKFNRKNKVSTTIPTASMPDIIFMLLIFFMVSTVLKQYPGLKLSLPDAEMIKKMPVSKRHVVTIWLDRNNQIACDDFTIDKLSDLRNILYEKRSKDPLIVVAMKVDKEADMGYVSDVHQEMRKAYALNLNYSAIPGGY